MNNLSNLENDDIPICLIFHPYSKRFDIEWMLHMECDLFIISDG